MWPSNLAHPACFLLPTNDITSQSSLAALVPERNFACGKDRMLLYLRVFRNIEIDVRALIQSAYVFQAQFDVIKRGLSFRSTALCLIGGSGPFSPGSARRADGSRKQMEQGITYSPYTHRLFTITTTHQQTSALQPFRTEASPHEQTAGKTPEVCATFFVGPANSRHSTSFGSAGWVWRVLPARACLTFWGVLPLASSPPVTVPPACCQSAPRPCGCLSS